MMGTGPILQSDSQHIGLKGTSNLKARENLKAIKLANAVCTVRASLPHWEQARAAALLRGQMKDI